MPGVRNEARAGLSKAAAPPTDVKDSHLQCHPCELHFKSHSSHLNHIANTHPDRVDDLPVGRLGNAVFYQPTAKLFHCHICFFTTSHYPQVYDHLLANHCFSEKVEGKRGGEGEAEEVARSEESKAGEELDLEPPAVAAESAAQVSIDTEKEEGKGGVQKGGGQHDDEKRPGSSDVSLKRKRSPAAISKEDDNEEDEDVKPAAAAAVVADATQEEKEKAVLTEYTLFSGNRYVCRLCGWKSKMRGFIMSHVSRSHNVPKPFACKHCDRTYILESQLLSHVGLWHKQGLYRCPFCFFSSDLLRGMRRHSNRCSTRLDEGEGSDGGE